MRPSIRALTMAIAAALSDGTVLVGGETASFGAGSDDAFLLRLDANGRGIACNSWGGTGLDHGDDVEVAPSGTVLLGGRRTARRRSPSATARGGPRRCAARWRRRQFRSLDESARRVVSSLSLASGSMSIATDMVASRGSVYSAKDSRVSVAGLGFVGDHGLRSPPRGDRGSGRWSV